MSSVQRSSDSKDSSLSRPQPPRRKLPFRFQWAYQSKTIISPVITSNVKITSSSSSIGYIKHPENTSIISSSSSSSRSYWFSDNAPVISTVECASPISFQDVEDQDKFLDKSLCVGKCIIGCPGHYRDMITSITTTTTITNTITIPSITISTITKPTVLNNIITTTAAATMTTTTITITSVTKTSHTTKKKTSHTTPIKKKSKIKKKQLSPIEKKTILITRRIVKEKGVKLDTFLSKLKNEGINVSRTNIFRWEKEIKTGRFNNMNSTGKTRGRKRTLSTLEEKLLLGFCYWMAKNNNSLIPAKMRIFVNVFSGKSFSYISANRFLKANKFSSKKERTKQAGFEHDLEFYCLRAKEWFKSTFEVYIKNTNPNKILSIDFTYSSFRLGRKSSWSPIGANQPRDKRGYTRYTDCIVTCCWANGEKMVKLYTYNPKFKTIGYWENISINSNKKHNITKRRKIISNTYKKLREELGVKENLVSVLYFDGSNTKTFVRESQDLIIMWLNEHKNMIENETTIFHDAGTALNNLSQLDIFKEKKLRAVEYDSEIHHVLSPNDNKWHGVAKNKWRYLCRERMVDKTQGVESSLLLVKCLLETKKTSIQKYFQNNLFFGERKPSVNKINIMIEQDKNLKYGSYKAKQAMLMFNKWRKGRLRNNTIKYQPGIKMLEINDSEKAKKYKRLMDIVLC